MADIAASVLARLKNKAKESGRSYQLCLQLFCQEEFLRRLEKSQYEENLVLKGGLFIYSITGFDSRVTVDVDFLLRKVPNAPEQLQTVIETIISTPTGNEFVTFEIRDIAPIAVAKKYAGIGVSLMARIKNTKTPFSIDFGVGDVIVPKQEKRKIPTQLDGFTEPAVNTYSLETTIAEKIDLLFFHRGLQRLVAFELKVGKFKPEYISKMDFYLEALDRQKKKENENPSVGMILCASKDDEVVEYAMSRTLSPMMVAEYQLQLPDKNILQKKLQELINMPLLEDDE